MTGTNYAALFYSKTGNDIAALEENIKDHPVSSLSQFLLLYHYKKNQDPRFEKLARQTVLYFGNPNWLRFQLEQNDETGHFAVIIPEENNKAEEISIPAGSDYDIPESTITEEENSNKLSSEKIYEEEMLLETKAENVSIETSEITNEHLPAAIEKQEIIAVEPKNESIESFQNNENPDLSTFNSEDPAAFKPNEEVLQNDPSKSDAALENVKEEAQVLEPEEETGKNNQLPEILNVEGVSKENPEINPSAGQTQASSLEATHEEAIAFEPLHTIDYFASQGIKIREDVLMNDKLGKQMKSFTDWLKSMKKLHPGKLPEQNEVIERIIQSSAEESNADAEVLTEAMAEVLIKQNKREKAVEMYEKLSLMNPSKSAYFAAKIESIKTN